jgi:hypothetical protein
MIAGQIDVNPDHQLPDEIARGIHEYRQARWRLEDEAFELAKRARPSAEERKYNEDLRDRSLAATGSDLRELRDVKGRFARERTERLYPAAIDVTSTLGDLLDWDLHLPTPPPSDPNFWYATAQMWADPPFAVSSENDGFVFQGMKTHDDGDLIKLSFGCALAYELQAQRIPTSASGRWRSAPLRTWRYSVD